MGLWSGNVYAIVKVRLRVVGAEIDKATSDLLLDAMQVGDFLDILDEETIEYVGIEQFVGGFDEDR